MLCFLGLGDVMPEDDPGQFFQSACKKVSVFKLPDGKASACNAGDLDSTPGSGRSPGEGNGNPLQFSCLENSMDGEA